MSELCNNSACFSVEIKGTSDICVIFAVHTCGKSILGVRTHEKLLRVLPELGINLYICLLYKTPS